MSKKILSISLIAAIFIQPIFFQTNARADVTTNPTLSLDATNPRSLISVNPTYWYDLVSNGSIYGTLRNSPTYSSADGGSLTFSGANNNGVYFAPAAVGHATNPSGSMTLESWVKFTSWSATWNIFATRWFTNFAGAGTRDFHFAVQTNGTSHKLNLYTTSTDNINGTQEIALNTWYLLGFTLNNTSQELKFFINGQQDGTTVTGITRTANTANYLFVGDPRDACNACALNGQIAKFRMWNSVLTSTQMLSNFRSEGAGYGFASTTSISAATFPNPNYRASNLVTATVSKPGKVTFYQQGVVIPGCKNKTAATTTATCSWKPSRRGKVSVSASLTPTDLGFVPSSGVLNFNVSNRSGTRG